MVIVSSKLRENQVALITQIVNDEVTPDHFTRDILSIYRFVEKKDTAIREPGEMVSFTANIMKYT